MKKLLIAILLCAALLAAVPFAASADAPEVPTVKYDGYQIRANGTAYDYRVIGVLTLPDGYDLAKVTDVGFKIVVDNVIKTASETVSCKMVYSSVQGGGVTYHAGTGEDTETEKYLGGNYLFVLVIESAPWNLNGSFVPYVTYEEGSGDGTAQDVVMMGLKEFDPNMPTTLKDGTNIKLVPVTDGSLTVADTTVIVTKNATEFTGTTQTVFDGDNIINLKQYRGMMIKVTPDKTANSGMVFRFKFVLSNGTVISLSAVENEERTHYWYYNGTWTEKTEIYKNNFTMQNNKIVYAYFDFNYITTTLKTAFPELLSGRNQIKNLQVEKLKGNRLGTFSEWCLVKEIPAS